MKKIFLLFCLFFSIQFYYGQQYEVVIKNYNYNGWTKNVGCNSAKNNIKITVFYTDGSSNDIYMASAEDNLVTPVLLKVKLLSGKYPSRLKFYSELRSRTKRGTCGKPAIIDELIWVSNFCVSNYFSAESTNKDRSKMYVSFNYDIYPVINLKQPTSTIIGYEDIRNIDVTSESSKFSSNVYNWQYQVVSTGGLPQGDNWIDLPQFSGQTNIDFKPSEHFSWNGVTGRIYFRIKSCFSNFSDNIIFYDLRQSSPHVIKTIVKNPTCFDSTDGEIKFSFDRQLDEEETLSLQLEKKSPYGDFYDPYDSYENLTELKEENTTFSNQPPGSYRLQLIGKYKGLPTYTGGEKHTVYVEVKQPAPVTFDTKVTHIRCKGGHDGIIELLAQGGQKNYLYKIETPDGIISNWIPFAEGDKTQIENLGLGEYKIQVKDINDCISREIIKDNAGNMVGLGNEIIKSITITEPEKPVTIEYVDFKNPSAYGFTDGYIKANITGGIPYQAEKQYNYIWRYEDGTVWNTVKEEIFPGNEGWFITLQGAKAGKYILTVTDSNYDSAIDKEGCIIAESEFILTQPDPLEAKIEVYKIISCNADNEFGDETDIDPQDGQRDESQDGALKAFVKGGVKPYKYIWKKEINGIWKEVKTQTDSEEFSIAYNLSDGNYSFNIIDANGITIGEYVNNQLDKETPLIQYFIEPKELKITLQSTDVTCNPGNNGSIKAIVTGGTAPYIYEWTTGETTPEIRNLIAGVYKVIITDANGCRVEGNIVLSQPGEINIQETVVDPVCYDGEDGKISLIVTGGIAPYLYEWNTGETTSDINDLKKGIYTVKITDGNGCIAIKNIEVKNPKQITINLGGDRVLCKGQKLEANAEIEDAIFYQWTSSNGFTSSSPKVTISDPGTYKVEAITPLGCIVSDEITITRSEADISSEFLLISQAYTNEEVILINVSNPLGKTTSWEVPAKVQTINKDDRHIVLKFPSQGTYTIGLTSTQGQCWESYEKKIIVEESANFPDPGQTDHPFIQEFTLTPNPNNGNFSIKIKLAEESPVAVRIFSISGELISGERKLEGNNEYELEYQISNLPPAVYVIVLETAKGTRIKRMITY